MAATSCRPEDHGCIIDGANSKEGNERLVRCCQRSVPCCAAPTLAPGVCLGPPVIGWSSRNLVMVYGRPGPVCTSQRDHQCEEQLRRVFTLPLCRSMAILPALAVIDCSNEASRGQSQGTLATARRSSGRDHWTARSARWLLTSVTINTGGSPGNLGSWLRPRRLQQQEQLSQTLLARGTAV